MDDLIKSLSQPGSKPSKEELATQSPKKLMNILTPENIKSYFAEKEYRFFDTPDSKIKSLI